mmetsp:Transcript_9171/g.23226  ORF Transcript_9171/g.23226 Transcript_9171/m.23226 type:complete len:112 (-) Transcript_9171:687-1022(-)
MLSGERKRSKTPSFRICFQYYLCVESFGSIERAQYEEYTVCFGDAVVVSPTLLTLPLSRLYRFDVPTENHTDTDSEQNSAKRGTPTRFSPPFAFCPSATYMKSTQELKKRR